MSSAKILPAYSQRLVGGKMGHSDESFDFGQGTIVLECRKG